MLIPGYKRTLAVGSEQKLRRLSSTQKCPCVPQQASQEQGMAGKLFAMGIQHFKSKGIKLQLGHFLNGEGSQ